MTCREFKETAEALELLELGSSRDEHFLVHQRMCTSCAGWMQQQQRVAGAMRALRNSTAQREAPSSVEHAVMRAFRQTMQPSALPAGEDEPATFVFRLIRIFGWGAYAAAAAALAISLGLGIWYWQHARNAAPQSAQRAQTTAPQSTSAEAMRPPALMTGAPQIGALSAKSQEARKVKKAVSTPVDSGNAGAQPDAQLAQSQGYVPMMLCDPLSCSGDEQVVRMELPASTVDSSRDSSQPLMADVVVGDDGLVRAIRIVQQ